MMEKANTHTDSTMNRTGADSCERLKHSSSIEPPECFFALVVFTKNGAISSSALAAAAVAGVRLEMSTAQENGLVGSSTLSLFRLELASRIMLAVCSQPLVCAQSDLETSTECYDTHGAKEKDRCLSSAYSG